MNHLGEYSSIFMTLRQVIVFIGIITQVIIEIPKERSTLKVLNFTCHCHKSVNNYPHRAHDLIQHMVKTTSFFHTFLNVLPLRQGQKRRLKLSSVSGKFSWLLKPFSLINTVQCK